MSGCSRWSAQPRATGRVCFSTSRKFGDGELWGKMATGQVNLLMLWMWCVQVHFITIFWFCPQEMLESLAIPLKRLAMIFLVINTRIICRGNAKYTEIKKKQQNCWNYITKWVFVMFHSLSSVCNFMNLSFIMCGVFLRKEIYMYMDSEYLKELIFEYDTAIW